MPITDPVAFIEALLSDPEFRRELEEEDQRKWETFTLRLLVWDGESEELPDLDRTAERRSAGRSDSVVPNTTNRRRQHACEPFTATARHPAIDSQPAIDLPVGVCCTWHQVC